jgi:hypothetical protein
LFEIGDALLASPTTVASLPHLSLEPACGRGWGSVYAALSDGQIDEAAARELLVEALPGQWGRPVFAVDTSPWPRPAAVCSPRRGMCRVPDPGGDRRGRMVPGWVFQWVNQVSPDQDSWTAPADVVRVDVDDSANEIAGQQMQQVAERVARLHPERGVPIFAFDAGYCPITMTLAAAANPQAPARVIVRIRRDRVFYTDPPARVPGTPGRPRQHGERFDCADPHTWPTPTAELSTVDEVYGQVEVQAWAQLHPRPGWRRRWARNDAHGRPAPIVRGTVVRVQVSRRCRPDQPSVMWLWTAGPDDDELDVVWRAYRRRFAEEHTFRYLKQDLSWTTPAVRTPQQASLWSWLVAVAYTQLRLARPLVVDQRLPWEKRLDPASLTPNRTRRGFRRLAPTLGSPTRPRKPHRPGPGRPKGSANQHTAPRHKVIKKGRPRGKR